MGKPVEVGDSNFQQEVINSDKPVLVDFSSSWCGPCKALDPVIEQMADEYAGKLKVAKLMVDNNQATARQWGVMSFPTLVVFKGGKAVERVVGFTPKANLVRAIQPHI